MNYIVALGNPGEKYASTRHNIGWVVMDSVSSLVNLPSPHLQSALSGRVTDGKIAGVSVTVLYPDTYMNNSGAAVRKFVPRGELQNLIVLYDDIDLPFGEIKVTFGRGAGGHNGLTSIIEKMGSKDFVRVRIGIGKVGFWPWSGAEIKRPKGGGALEKYVLGNLTKKELGEIEQMSVRTLEVITTILKDGHVTAMNKFN